MELEKSFLKIALCFSVNPAISWNLSPRQADSSRQPHGASVRAGRQSSGEDVVFLPAQVADSNTVPRGVLRGPRDLSAHRDSKCSARRSLPSGVLRTHFAAFLLKTLASAVQKVHLHTPSRARARRPVERLPSAETAPGHSCPAGQASAVGRLSPETAGDRDRRPWAEDSCYSRQCQSKIKGRV